MTEQSQFTRISEVLMGEPGRTDYDINFRIFGFPVRIHPAFFIMPLVLGQGFLGIGNEPNNVGIALLVLEFVFLLSILVHELGHSFAMRFYGMESHIVLYWMGGLAIPGNNFTSWDGGRRRAVSTPTSQIIISLAGPFFGFALAATLAGLTYLLGGKVYNVFSIFGFIPLLFPDLSASRYAGNSGLIIFLAAGLYCNIFWNLLNLIPAMPLDGGQVARNLFAIFDPWHGVQKAAILGTIAAGGVAILGLTNHDVFMGLMFGMLAFQNYQMSNSGMGGGRPW